MAALPRDVLDALTHHAIDLTRYSNGVVRRMIAILNRADASLSDQIRAALERLPANGATLEHIEMVLRSVQALNAEAYRALTGAMQDEMLALAASEAKWQGNLYGSMLQAGANLSAVGAQQVYAAALSRPFQGRLLKEWAASIEAQRMTRIRDAVRMGYIEGKTTGQIVQAVRGTRARGYSDGIIEIDRRHAEAVVRTALSHTAATARNEFFNENDDLLGDEVWIATLDGRTSPICRARSGKRYDKNHKPVGHKLEYLGGPGRAHWNCRSTGLRLLKGQTELYGTQSSQAGYIDANLSYGQWLKGQPASVQDDILGPTRGKLFRNGGLELDGFVNDKGRTLTLDELERKNAAAFKRAGIE